MAAKNAHTMGDVGPRAFAEWVKSQLSPDGSASDATIARTIGISPSVLSRYRTDLTQPSFDVVRRAADKIGVPIIAALVKAGMISQDEAGVKVVEPRLAEIPAEKLFDELKRRYVQVD